MEQKEVIKRNSKLDRVNLLHRIYSTWVLPLYKKGFNRETLTIDDIWAIPKQEDSELLADRLEENWRQELKKKKPSFAWAGVKTFWMYMLPATLIFMWDEVVLRMAQALMLAQVMKVFSRGEWTSDDYNTAYLNTAGIVLCSLIYILGHHPACYIASRLAIKIRVSICTLMYRKAIRLNHSAFGKTTIGQILNLMSNDVSRFDEFCIICSYMVVAPVQTVVGMIICYYFVGYYSLIGLGALLAFIPFNSVTGRLFLKVRTKVATLSDTRIRLMNEIIRGMRVIKMYAWEKHFSALIGDSRRAEMAKIRIATFLRAVNISISMVAQRIILFVIFIAYARAGYALKAEKVFVVMLIINTVRHKMTWLFPNSVALLYELKVSIKRIQRFLELNEINEEITEDEVNTMDNHFFPSKALPYVKSSRNDQKPAISVKSLTARWESEPTTVIRDGEEKTSAPTLENINVELDEGELLAVIGPVGSGKSSFLMSLMNEIGIASGGVKISGSVAYASQEPWSYNASVRSNILFGSNYDSHKFSRVIDVCAMKRDLSLWEHGENTLVGERGVSLSGGQKARITLARALYADADIFLLDDPLSAVDSEVANHIFEKCIMKHLRSKTVVLVTHQIQFIKKASKILVLKDGQQFAYGSYSELVAAGVDVNQLIKKPKKVNESESATIPQEIHPESPAILARVAMKNRTVSVISTAASELSIEAPMDQPPPLIQEEEKGVGSVSAAIYAQYIKAGSGTFLMLLMIVSTIASQVMFQYTDLWLSQWTNEEDKKSSEGDHPRDDVDENEKTLHYSALIIAQFVLMILRTGAFFTMCITASINLHNGIFYKLMRTPISFFDNNPTGRILNRFTKDIGIVDEQLPLAAYDLNLIVTQVIGTLVIVAFSQWTLMFPALVMIVLIVVVRTIYIRTALYLRRFEATARSPIFNHMSITLNGLATIRAFNAQPLFVRQYYRFQNDHTATYLVCMASSRLLGITMDMICMAYISAVAVFLMIFAESIEAGTAGLAFSLALGLTGVTQWGVRQSAELDNQMTSVERLIEYSKLETERALESAYKFPPDWPAHGGLKLDHVSLYYSGRDEPVLKQLTCEIRPSEKIGIVGRTGAGKSSILAALFQMSRTEGTIYVDGVDVSEIGLHELRRNMSIIPQEPMAFIGSLRKNLDPFDEHDDKAIWASLEEVQLRRAVMDMPGQLEYQLSEGGGNLSVGQRQLICLARALLRRNRILVLDEATASVDHRTDALIQRTIRQNFADCTVLTIAHRLNTVIDSDRIMVLDAGQLVEFDTPYNLLQQPGGIFSNLVHQTGPQTAAKLVEDATARHFGGRQF